MLYIYVNKKFRKIRTETQPLALRFMYCVQVCNKRGGGGKRLAALISSETLPLENKKNPKKTGGSIAQEQKKTRGAISNGSNNARSFF